jgi:hypothetical protein
VIAMSGIEVAGIVLGAIPLLISGLEHYAEGVATIRRTFKYQAEFRSLSRQLRVESGIFQNTIELLLTGCVAQDKITELLESPGGKGWQNPDVADSLRQKLGRVYDVYLETVESMSRTVHEFKARLKLNDDGKVSPSFCSGYIAAYYTKSYRVLLMTRSL